MRAIELIYGNHVIDDLKFCEENNEAILQYDHCILTLQGSPRDTLAETANDPSKRPGFRLSLEEQPENYAILQEFFKRLVRHYDNIGKFH